MGDIQTRNAERRLQRARECAEMPTNDPGIATRSLQQLAATLPSTRPGVTNDVEASKRHARALARELKLDKGATCDLVLAAELHEVGKATIDRDALYAPGELDAETRVIVEAHAANAAELVAAIERPEVVAALAMQNERHDGTGPAGIRGEDLSVLTRALSVISAYVAMTSKRPFRPALDRDHALEVLSAGAGSQFDTDIVEAFIRTIPQKKFAVVAAGTVASIARPSRGIQLAYRRHGRVTTAMVASFSAAAVLIAASSLAPGGIGQAIERMSWPTQTEEASSSSEDASIALAGDESSDASNADASSEAPVAGTLGGLEETFASDLTGSTSTEVTQIESGYSYNIDNGDMGSDSDGQTTSGGNGGTTTESDDGASQEPTSDEGSTADAEDDSEATKHKDEGKDKDRGHSTEDEEGTPEPEPSESPAPEETEDDSDKFKAYQSAEQDDKTEDVETSDSDTDDVDSEGKASDEPVESDPVEEEKPVAKAPRDNAPKWGSLH